MTKSWVTPESFVLRCRRRDDGGLQISCEEVPGFALSARDPAAAMADVLPVIDVLMRHNGPSSSEAAELQIRPRPGQHR